MFLLLLNAKKNQKLPVEDWTKDTPFVTKLASKAVRSKAIHCPHSTDEHRSFGFYMPPMVTYLNPSRKHLHGSCTAHRTASDILVAVQKTDQSRPPLQQPRAAREPKCLTRMRECIQAAMARFL